MATLPVVQIRRGKIITTSLDVAEKFNKQHSHVLDKLKKLECSGDFWESNFRLRDYVDERGKTHPEYLMTKDGFMFLAMGFTGKKAVHWKEQFIGAFNSMEVVLSNQANGVWQELREQGKTARLSETDTIAEFVEYATDMGSKNAKHYYSNITNATYKALFLVKAEFPCSLRNALDNMQLSFLQTAEFIASNALREGMNSNLQYKEIYKLCKIRLIAFAETVGVTSVLSNKSQHLQLAGNQ